MIRRILATLANDPSDKRWITVYCGRCGGNYPAGHGH